MRRYIVLITLLGAVGGSLFATWMGRLEADVGPLALSLEWSFASRGTTQLIFPPLGEVIAATHLGPSKLTVMLRRVELNSLQEFINDTSGSRNKAVDTLMPQVVATLRRFVAYLLVLAAVGGALAAFLVAAISGRRLGASHVGIASLAGLLVVGAIMGTARATYQLRAFASPTYRGALEAVPWVIQAVEDGLGQVEELDQRLRTLSRHVYRMYRQVDEVQPPVAIENADVTILHVTDFHNHPAAASIVIEMAKAFGVDFVVNTGDLTDFGTVIESGLIDGLAKLPVPQYFVSGNHESPAVIQRLQTLEYFRFLDGRQVQQSNLVLAGVADPGSSTPSPATLNPAEAADQAAKINASIEATAPEKRPDLLAIHNFRVAQGIKPGLVPMVLFGHSHKPSVRFQDGTAYINAGTTGGAGLRGVEAGVPVPITMTVIYVKTDTGSARVIAVDLVRLSPVAAGFTLERRLAPIAGGG